MTEIGKSRILEYTGRVLLLAALNYVFGKIGLLTAVQPGFASIFWPPAGIAIAMMLVYGCAIWPGVFIASFLFNSGMPEALLTGGTMEGFRVLAACGIAFGSSVQAVISCILIRRYFTLPVSLARTREVVTLMLAAGPVGCLIAATIGVTSLHFVGIVREEAFLQNWLTWWGGDVLGVFVFMPLFLVCSGTFERVFETGKKALYPYVAIIALIIPLGATLAAWKVAAQASYEKAHDQFAHLAIESEAALQHRMNSYEQSLLSGIGLIAGSASVERGEWHAFAKAMQVRDRFPGINGIGYIADVPADGVKSFLRETRADDAPDFSIHPEVTNNLYFVIKYIEPVDINAPAMGLNIAFEEERRLAAVAARDTGAAAITGRITLVQDNRKGAGFLLLLPVYKAGMPVNTVEERRLAHEGWVYAPFIARNFMKGLTINQGDDFNLTVYDGTEEKIGALLYTTDASAHRPAFTVRKKIGVKQQEWTLVWTSTKEFEQRQKTNEAIIILVSGLLFTALLGAVLQLQARRTDVVEEQVYIRTAELAEREAHLAQVVDRLTESNTELERFAYVVSHDMQEPIRMVSNFSSLLWHQYQDKMDASGKKYLDILIEGSRRLQNMITDLLEYARLGQAARGMQEIDSETMLQYVLENLNFVIYEHEAVVTHDKLPVFMGYPVQFMSLLQNLISNAIKYQPKGAEPKIHVGVEDGGDHWLFSIRDNGIGIDPKNADKIFEPFKRLHTYQDYPGTGLGLSACKKIVSNHGGRIWVESEQGVGSTFFFTIMK